MRFKILKVVGNSMHPTLASGAFVLLWQSPSLYQSHPINKNSIKGKLSAYISQPKVINNLLSAHHFKHSKLIKALQFMGGRQLAIGDIVAINHPKYGEIIKRISELRYVAEPDGNQEYSQNHHQKSRHKHGDTTVLHSLRLTGDNTSASVSTDAMGWVDVAYLLGVVVAVVNTPSDT